MADRTPRRWGRNLFRTMVVLLAAFIVMGVGLLAVPFAPPPHIDEDARFAALQARNPAINPKQFTRTLVRLAGGTLVQRRRLPTPSYAAFAIARQLAVLAAIVAVGRFVLRLRL